MARSALSGRAATLSEIAPAFSPLGLCAFGRPLAHIGMMQRELVDRRSRLDTARFAEGVTIRLMLPGPISTRLVVSLRWLRAGFRAFLRHCTA